MTENWIFLKHFLNLNLSIVLWFRCFVAEEPILELINYMSKPSDVYVMITKPRSQTYSQKMVHLHHRNLQTFLLEMYNIRHNLSESCLKDLFSAVNGNYKLRSQSDFRVLGIKKFFMVLIQLGILDQWYGDSLPHDLTNICDFNLFKMTIRRWKSVDCPCRLCKNYLDSLGFITISS